MVIGRGREEMLQAALENLKDYDFECLHVSSDMWTVLVHMNILW